MSDFVNQTLIAVDGATFTEDFQYLEDDCTTPIDLTGFTGKMEVRDCDDNLVLELNTTNGRFIFPDPSNGIIKFIVDATTMDALSPGDYVYDSFLINGAVVDPFINGSFIIEKRVTQTL